ncbi:MAG: ABC transporter permease subunit [Gloeomargarita sp. SKYBB_i_bin120]|nr:ABC transporter permease subunit [Gloeomargarita sp. SKYB120]MDW8178093.1 ABC transporter permease subunit [Gloeomargarita sp. SKYBB_i_bin120]
MNVRTIWANFVAIYRKELQGYFATSLNYVIAGVYWFVAGVFYIILFNAVQANVAAQDLQGQAGLGAPPVDVPAVILENYLGVLGSLSLFVLPLLSMNLFAQERQQGTLELLATSPITTTMVAIGKLAGVLTFFITLLLPIVFYESLTLLQSEPPFSFGLILLGHGALVLLAAAILSLGLFISATTESTLLAAVGTFGLILLLWILQAIADRTGGWLANILRHFSLLQNYTSLIQGSVSSTSIVVFLSYVVLGLFLTVQWVDGLRFQRA